MTVRCPNAYSMELAFIKMRIPRRAKKQYHPSIHLGRYLGTGWSSVHAPSKSHVVVKFAAVPKKDEAKLKRQLGNEKITYHILVSRITGW
jgi:hypothetical protein